MRRMTSEEITASLAEYRERTISIARDAPKTRAPGNLQKYIDDAYSQGVVARRMGLTSGEEAMHYEQFWNAFQNYDIPERESFEAGLRGAEKPYWVNGWRYGDIPSGGYSMNFAEGRPERGISVMGTDDGRTTGDPGFEMFTRNREIIYVSGFVNTTSTGSDGEPLLMWARKTGVRK